MSGRPTDSTALATGPNWSRPKEREGTRDAILEAARRLIERRGADALTLSAVAVEAHVARATIYGYFSSRRELLSRLAAVPDAPAEPLAPRERSAGDPAPEEPGYEKLMRAQAQALDHIAKQVIVPRPRMREATDATLVRMETRLSVAEKSLATLDKRVSDDAKGLVARTASITDTLEQLKARLEKLEEKQQAAVAELRLDVLNLRTAADAPAPAAAVEVRTTEPAAAPEPQPDNETVRAPGYLEAARHAATSAAQRSAAQRQSSSRSAKRRFKRSVWRWIALAAAIVAAFDIYVFAAYRSIPEAHAATLPPPRQTAAKPPTLAGLAASGNVEAELMLGLKLLNGDGAAIDVGRAARWLERAAAAGQPVAQNYVGVLYQTGTGVAADMNKAVAWYQASARQGNLQAMSNLGKAYAGGWKDGTDFAKAAQWFSRAAALGDVDAQFDLAVLYERGEGVPQSTADAYRWYAVAAGRGDSNATARASILGAQLTPEERQAAADAVAAFKPLPVARAANDLPQTVATAPR